jgi:hypothetical protein
MAYKKRPRIELIEAAQIFSALQQRLVMTAQDVQAANVQMDAAAVAVAVPVSVAGCVTAAVPRSIAWRITSISRLVSITWAVRRHDRMPIATMRVPLPTMPIVALVIGRVPTMMGATVMPVISGSGGSRSRKHQARSNDCQRK